MPDDIVLGRWVIRETLWNWCGYTYPASKWII